MTRIELHNESAISRPRSLITPWEIISESKKSDCAAIAFTDYNSVEAYGISEYECSRAGLQMIYGITMNCIDRDDRYDIVLLAKIWLAGTIFSDCWNSCTEMLFLWRCHHSKPIRRAS